MVNGTWLPTADGTATFTGQVWVPDLFALRKDLLSGGDTTITVDLSTATMESGEPNPNAATKTLWYEFTEPDASSLRRRVKVAGAGADVVKVAVFTGADPPVLTALTQVAAGTDVTFDVAHGMTYYVQVGLVSGTGSGASLTAMDGATPPGGTFATAITIDNQYGTVDATTKNSPLEAGEPVPAGATGTASAWLKWTCPTPAPAEMTFTVAGNIAFNATVYTGSALNALTQVVTAAGIAGGSVTLTFTPTAGTVYRIQIVAADPGDFIVSWYDQPTLMTPEPLARYARVEVYERDGLTLVTEVPRRYGVSFQERLNTTGMGSVTVHLDDEVVKAYPNLFAFGRVVKFWFGNTCVSGFRVKQRHTTHVSSEEWSGYVLTAEGPTLLHMLDDFMVRHDGPYRKDSLDVRYYSWASRPGEWYNAADWNDPIVDAPLNNPPGGNMSPRTPKEKRKKWGHPKGWPDDRARWTFPASTTAEATEYGGTVYDKTKPGSGYHRYYRRNFEVVNNGTLVRLFATADEDMEVYLDGEEMIRQEVSEFGYKTFNYRDVILSAGLHTVAVHTITGTFGVKNRDANDSFLFAAMTLDDDGKPETTLLRSNRKWKAWIGNRPPGWNRAQVLRSCVQEAQGRGVQAAQSLSLGFTATTDSEGRPWIDRFNQEVQIGTSGLDLQAQLSEGGGFDVWVRPSDMSLRAARRKGTDRSASVTLEPGRNLIDWSVDETDEVRNDFLVQFDGGWVRVQALPSQKNYDKREAYVELGHVKDDESARTLMREVIRGGERERNRAGTPQVKRRKTGQPDGGLIGVHGAFPFTDWTVGDVVKAPNAAGVMIRQRCLGLTCTEDEHGNLTFDPEFEVYG